YVSVSTKPPLASRNSLRLDVKGMYGEPFSSQQGNIASASTPAIDSNLRTSYMRNRHFKIITSTPELRGIQVLYNLSCSHGELREFNAFLRRPKPAGATLACLAQ